MAYDEPLAERIRQALGARPASGSRGSVGQVSNLSEQDGILLHRLSAGPLGPRPDIAEKKMFGGLAFLLNGKMFCGIVRDELMVRVGPERYQEALGRPYARPMDFTGRPMNGYVFVAPAGCSTETALRAWVEIGAEFISSLNPGAGPTRKKRVPAASRRTPRTA